jgi:hypothetical protein
MTSEFAERLQSQSAEGSWQKAVGGGHEAICSRQRAVGRNQSAVGRRKLAVGKIETGASLGFVILDLEFYTVTVTFLEKR